MSAQDVFDHTERSWNDAVAYADTLRSRQSVFATVLVVVTGLGTFQASPLVGQDDVFAVPYLFARWTISVLLLGALVCMVAGAFVLYFYESQTEEEEAIRKEHSHANSDMPPIKRASDAFRLSPEEEAALVACGDSDDAAWMIRAKKLQFALRTLEAANRRVSNNIQRAGVLIGVGVVCVVAAVGIYSVSLNFRSEAHAGSNSGNPSAEVRLGEGSSGFREDCQCLCCSSAAQAGSGHSGCRLPPPEPRHKGGEIDSPPNP